MLAGGGTFALDRELDQHPGESANVETGAITPSPWPARRAP